MFEIVQVLTYLSSYFYFRSPIGAHPGMSIGASGMHHQAGNALSPNFHPALSPLATKSPSVSPLAVPAPPPMQQKDLHKTNI